MRKQRIGIALLAISLLSIFWIPPAQAQVQRGGWSEPYRLSSEAGKASEGYLAADRYGYVHCFWTEILFENELVVIKYARFDGATWSHPNDIYVTNRRITNVSPFVDQYGTLHIAWAEGLVGPAYYTSAPANNAFSAQNWAEPIKIDIPARTLYLRVDSKGIFHILYVDQTEESGIYYIRSEDKGTTWSEPVWLDPDILPGHTPDSLNFEIDETDGLHAVWMYGARDLTAKPDWVRYIHSLDGGHTWSTPFLIDQHDEMTNHKLTTAGPVMMVQGQNVHVIWAAGELPYRYHRFSTDSGQTWNGPVQIFGDLHGQAFDGLAVDRSGRLHFFGQIRYPMAIHHAYWDQTRWSKPSLVYLISQDGSEGSMGDRVHAHYTLPVIRAGNQLVLTFGDGPADPNRRLFVMYRTLDDILPLENMPTPYPTATLVPVSTPTPGQPTPMPTQTATAPSLESAEVRRVPAPDLAIQVALVPTLLVLGVTIIIQLYRRRR